MSNFPFGEAEGFTVDIPDPPPTPRPHVAAQALELRARLAGYNRPMDPPLRQGDLVREKHGIGVVRQASRDTLLLVFWRRLRWWNPFDLYVMAASLRTPSFPGTANCIVAFVQDDGGPLLFMAHDARQLERAAPPVDE